MSEITVTGPDGSAFSFPLGTPPNVIQDAMTQHYASIKYQGGTQSGDEARAAAAGDTRAKMRLPDIERAYDTAAGRGDTAEAQNMARAYVQREHADSPTLMGIDDRLRAVARGVPILGGLADEANAATSAMLGGGYQKSLDYQRARDSYFDEMHPKESTAEQMAGGVASGLGIASRVAPVLSSIPRAFALGSGVAGGASLGAADQFTRGEGVDDRFQKALAGAAIGGVVGGVAPVIGKGFEYGTNKLVDALTRADSIGKLGLSSPSNTILRRALEADGTLGERGVANIRSAGPEGMLVDASPNLPTILDTAIQRSAGGAQGAKKAVESRVASATKQVEGSLNRNLGAPMGVTATETGLRQGTAAIRNAAYEAAYNSPIDYAAPEARDLQDLLKRVPGAVVAKANQLMQLEGHQSKQIMAHIADDGSVTYQRLPDVRQLDYITRALNDVATSGEGQGALGGQTAIGRAYGNLSKSIRDTVKGLVPEYENALSTAAQPIQARNALKLGQEALSPSMTRDAFAEQVRGMTPAEKAALKQGIRSHIDDVLANVKRTVMDPNVDARQAAQAIKDLSSEAARTKIETVLGPLQAKGLFNDLDQAARAFDLRARVAENSKTFARGVLDDTVKQATEPGAVGQLMQGSPAKAGRSLVQALLGTGPEQQIAKQEEIYGQLVRALTGRRGPEAQEMLEKFAKAAEKKGNGERVARALSALVPGAASLPLYQAIDQQTKR